GAGTPLASCTGLAARPTPPGTTARPSALVRSPPRPRDRDGRRLSGTRTWSPLGTDRSAQAGKAWDDRLTRPRQDAIATGHTSTANSRLATESTTVAVEMASNSKRMLAASA